MPLTDISGIFPIFVHKNQTMNKTLSRILKIAGGTVLSLAALLTVAGIIVNQESFQKKIVDYASDVLSEKLQTHINIDGASINLFTGSIGLSGLEVEDLQQRKMLTMKRLSANVKLLPLLSKELIIDKVEIEGLNALLLKKPGEPANYQFVIDAFKKDKREKTEDKEKPQQKKKFKFDIKGVKLSEIRLKYNEASFVLSEARMERDKDGVISFDIDNVSGAGELPTKSGNKSFQVSLHSLDGALTIPAKGEKRVLPIMPVNIITTQLTDVNVRYGEQAFSLDGISCKGGEQYDLVIDGAEADFTSKTKKGPVKNHVALKHLKALIADAEKTIDLEGIRFTTDNGLPRKNTGKPKKGFFDPGHLDLTANMKWRINHIGKDTLNATLTQATVKDSVTGIDITALKTVMAANSRHAYLSQTMLKLTSTVLNIADADITLPRKKEGIPLSYSTGQITGTVALKDISRPFAPVLKNFTIPLDLSLKMSGTDNSMSFKDIKVNTKDKKLTIAANGGMSDLKDKYKLNIHFDVNEMRARGNITEQIINQFTVKKLMMTQLKRLGDITYKGSFGVLWKKEEFRGMLGTAAGNINVYFALDENNKYINGKVNTRGFALGKVMDMSKIGGVDCNATFKIDFSKPRTAIMRKKKGGKLPIGEVKAVVEDCSYMGIHVRNLSVNMVSDGAVATGDLLQHGKHRDLSCSFSFTDTDAMQKMKITNPGIKFHKMSDEDKAAAAERKRLKKQEKAMQKALKKKEAEEKEKAEAADGKKKKKKRFLFF